MAVKERMSSRGFLGNATQLSRLTAVAIATLIATACSGHENALNAAPGEPPTMVRELQPTDPKPAPSVVIPKGLERLVELAKQDLASRIGVDVKVIKIVSAAYVSWRDASAGCPEPGYEYAQVLTNGSLIVLHAEGKIYQYHSAGDRPPILCENPSPETPMPYGPGDT
ncbi:MAG: hypothetical protein OEM03_10605 [Chromatiales bacterium]|nr:hypothetical protein [Chromatiales bacterium]